MENQDQHGKHTSPGDRKKNETRQANEETDGRRRIEWKDKAKYLGVLTDRKLTWIRHTEKTRPSLGWTN